MLRRARRGNHPRAGARWSLPVIVTTMIRIPEPYPAYSNGVHVTFLPAFHAADAAGNEISTMLQVALCTW